MNGVIGYPLSSQDPYPAKPLSSRKRLGIPGGDVALLGDSMTDWYNSGHATVTLQSAVYNGATGYLTLTYNTSPGYYHGMNIGVWSTAYGDLRDQVYSQIEFLSSTTWQVQLGQGRSLPSGVNVASGLFVRGETGRAIASFVSWLQMLIGWRLRVVRNAAQSGDTLDGARRRLSDLVDTSPSMVLGQLPGINDLSTSNGALSEDVIWAKLQAYLNDLAGLGAVVLLGNLTPVGSGEARGTRANMMTVLRLNERIAQFVRQRPGMALVDHYSTFVDIANATGLALASMVRSADFVHPAAKASLANGRKWAAVVQNILPTVDSALPKSLLDNQLAGRLTLIGSISVSNGLATATSTAHGWKVGEEFFGRGGSGGSLRLNGVFTVLAVPTANTFVYRVADVADGSYGGIGLSRSRNVYGNSLFQTTTGGTNNISGSVPGTLPDLIALSGTGVVAGTCGTRAAQNVTGSLLPDPVGNAVYADLTAAGAGDTLDFSQEGSSTIMNEMLPGRSYIMEGMLVIKSTAWGSTPVSNLLANFNVTDGVWNCQVGAFASADASETNTITADLRIHFRTPVLKVAPTGTLSAANFLVRVTNQAAFSAGPVLTVELSQLQFLDVTGQEEDYL